MNNTVVIVLAFLLLVCIGVILYQSVVCIRGTRKALDRISQKLSEILEIDSEEKIDGIYRKQTTYRSYGTD